MAFNASGPYEAPEIICMAFTATTPHNKIEPAHCGDSTSLGGGMGNTIGTSLMGPVMSSLAGAADSRFSKCRRSWLVLCKRDLVD